MLLTPNTFKMRNAVIIIFLILSTVAKAQTYELYNGDTINYTDKNNLKQGLWLKFDNNNKEIVEQGAYKANKKDGWWVSYYPNGNVKHKITFKTGKANGPAVFYYENGLVSEEGIWDVDHWVGNYKFYHENGSMAYDWNYDDSGKRTGSQKYYHKNGTLKYTGVWNKGKATGTLKIFNDEGKLITERVYNDGEFQENKAVTENIVTTEVAPTQELASAKTAPTFTGTGNHTVYNMNGQIEKQGFFVNGKIFTGKHCYYKADKTLSKIVHYQNGNVIRTEEK
jgi:antitoxin component YwqK of YwqJK toxin-antitoxin module